jgi:hypothetical protein
MNNLERIGLFQTKQNELTLYLSNFYFGDFCSKMPKENKLLFKYIVLTSRSKPGFISFDKRFPKNLELNNTLSLFEKEISICDFCNYIHNQGYSIYEYKATYDEFLSISNSTLDDMILSFDEKHSNKWLDTLISMKYRDLSGSTLYQITEHIDYMYYMHSDGLFNHYKSERVEDLGEFICNIIDEENNKAILNDHLESVMKICSYFNGDGRNKSFQNVYINPINGFQLIFSGIKLNGHEFAMVADTKKEYLMFYSVSGGGTSWHKYPNLFRHLYDIGFRPFDTEIKYYEMAHKEVILPVPPAILSGATVKFLFRFYNNETEFVSEINRVLQGLQGDGFGYDKIMRISSADEENE